MAWNYYFKDRSGAQNGPVSLEELVTLAKSGRIPPDAWVWAEGGEPQAAASHPALAGIFAQIASAPATGVGPLEPSFPVWGLFWRSIVLLFAFAFIIPAPWAGLWYYRWLAEHVALAGRAPPVAAKLARRMLVAFRRPDPRRIHQPGVCGFAGAGNRRDRRAGAERLSHRASDRLVLPVVAGRSPAAFRSTSQAGSGAISAGSCCWPCPCHDHRLGLGAEIYGPLALRECHRNPCLRIRRRPAGISCGARWFWRLSRSVSSCRFPGRCAGSWNGMSRRSS